MAITITINGVDQTAKVQDARNQGAHRLNYNRVAGSPATLTLFTYDKTGGGGGYRPAIDHTVVVADGATTLFSGVITDIRESSLTDAGDGFDKGILCAVTCADQNGLLLRDTYTQTYANGTTLKAILQDLIASVLTGRSITLDAGQATGPSIDGFEFEDAYIDDILNSLTTITGWIWDITPGKVLSMISPGTVSCGFSLTDGGGDVFGGVTFEQGRSESYANRVTVIYGPHEQLLKTQTIVGNGVLTEWALDYPSVRNAANYINSAGYVTDDGIFSPLSPYPGGTTNWQFDPTTNHLLRTGGALGNTKVATFVYAVQFPQSVTVNDSGEQAAHGIYVRRYTADDVTDLATATQLATGLLSQGIASPKVGHVTHRKGLSKPGQSVVLTFSERNVNATYMITEVAFWNEVDGSLTHSLTAISGSVAQPSWVEYFKRGGPSGAATASAAPISGALIPALSGIFTEDLIANGGKDDTATGWESRLTNYTNSAGEGPALLLGRHDVDYRWVITADSDHGSSPGTVAKMRFHIPRRGSSIEGALLLVEANALDDNFVVLPGASANLYLGDYAAKISGVSGGDARIEGILAQDIMALTGIFERSRTTRLGEFLTPSFNAADFTASAGSWTVDSGDVVTYAWTIVGKKMTVVFEINNTDVSATPTHLDIKVPGGFTVAKTTRAWAQVSDAGGAFQAGECVVAATGTVIQVFKDATGTATYTTTSADNTSVHGQITFEVQ